MCGIAGIIYRDGRAPDRRRHDGDAAGDEASRAGLDRLRALPPATEEWVMRVKLADANTPRDFDFHRAAARATAARSSGGCARMGARVDGIEELTDYAFDDRLRLRRRRPQGARRPGRGRPRDAEVLSLGHALEIVKDLGDARDRVARATASTVLRARTRSATCAWRPSPTSTSPARTRTGRIRSPTSRWSTTASSRTTTTGAGAWSATGTASSPSATRRSSPSTSPSG